MAEFENTLNSLLSNPEVMGQIMSFAKTLSGEEQTDAPPSQPEEKDSEPTTEIPDLSKLISGLSGSIDPSMFSMLGNLMQENGSSGQNDKNMALLAALRPFLKEKRQAKMDQAIQLAKLSRLARLAFKSMKGGDGLV